MSKLKRNISQVNFDIPTSATDNDIKEFLTAIKEAEAFLQHQQSDKEEEDGSMTRDQLLAKIREKKEVIEKLRCQPWPMQRKRRTLRLAQKYLQRHESKVSRTHLYREELSKKWKQFKRWCANISIYLIPWESKIKRIESNKFSSRILSNNFPIFYFLYLDFGSGHFGSVVSSYFVFLRWIFWINIIITAIMLSLIVVPETLADKLTSRLDNPNKTELYKPRKILAESLRETSDEILNVWEFKAYIAKSALFYGYYSNETSLISEFKYNLPLSYFLVNLLVLAYSFFAILRKMASNARMSKLTSGKTEQYQFAWKLFTGWDFSIGHAETASNAVMANVNKYKEAITDYKTKQRSKFQWLLLFRRILANILVMGMIGGSTYAILTVVERSRKFEQDPNASVLSKNEVPIVVSFITLVYPNIFEIISKLLEQFHPRTALRLQLGRILALYLLNFYTLIFALFYKMEGAGVGGFGYPSTPGNTTTSNLELVTPAATAAPLVSSVGELVMQNFTTSSTRFVTTLGRTFTNNYYNYNNNNNNNITAVMTSTLGSLPIGVPIPMLHFFQNYLRNKTDVEIRRRRDVYNNKKVAEPRKIRRQIPDEDDNEFVDQPRGVVVNSKDDDIFRIVAQAVTNHPDYGTIGVGKAKAFLKENVTEEELNKTVLVETFPVSTTSARPKMSPDIPGVVIPIPPYDEVYKNRKGDEIGSYDIPTPQPQTDEEEKCWETLIGQEICKLITMDLVMSIVAILCVDFFRGLWVRYCNRWWCWNLEVYFPEYGEFKVAENVLHLINNQGMIWLGVFFSPLLPAVNNIKLIILIYIRAWAVVTCNVPATQVFRASRSSNFYLILLLLMLFLCTLPVGYVIVQCTPSKACGPFGNKPKYYSILVDQLPEEVFRKLDYIASPGIVIPILVLLILVVYFLVSLIRGLREANQDLQKQLVLERTEEKRKIYQMAGGKKENHRASMALPETKKVDHSHLPEYEQKRRDETWRRVGQSDSFTEIIKEHDDDDEEYSPSLGGHSPPTPNRQLPPELIVPNSGGSHGVLYIPSLKSLPEEAGLLSSEGDDDKTNDEVVVFERSKSDSQLKVDHSLKLAPSLASMEEDLLSKSTPTTSRSVADDLTSNGSDIGSLNRNSLLLEKTPAYKEKIDIPSCYDDKPPQLKPFTILPLKKEQVEISPPQSVASAKSAETSTPNDEFSPNYVSSMISPSKFNSNFFESLLRRCPSNKTPPKVAPPPSNILIHISGLVDSDLDSKGGNKSSSETSGNEFYTSPTLTPQRLSKSKLQKPTTSKSPLINLEYSTAPNSPSSSHRRLEDREGSLTRDGSTTQLVTLTVVDEPDAKSAVVRSNGSATPKFLNLDNVNVISNLFKRKNSIKNNNNDENNSLDDEASLEDLWHNSRETMI